MEANITMYIETVDGLFCWSYKFEINEKPCVYKDDCLKTFKPDIIVECDCDGACLNLICNSYKEGKHE